MADTDDKKTAASTKETVFVACKLPHGLRLRLFAGQSIPDPRPDGTIRTVKMDRPIPGSVVVLKGYLERYTKLIPAAVTSSYAITEDVPKGFMDRWMKDNQEHEAVKNNLILVASSLNDLKAKMRECEKTRSGLEPLDPDALKIDPKRPRGGIETYSPGI